MPLRIVHYSATAFSLYLRQTRKSLNLGVLKKSRERFLRCRKRPAVALCLGTWVLTVERIQSSWQFLTSAPSTITICQTIVEDAGYSQNLENVVIFISDKEDLI